MGKTQPDEGLSDAAGGRAAGSLAARSALKAFWADERGATAIEYGIIVSLVFLVVVGSMTAFGNHTSNVMARVSNSISAAIGG